MYVFAGGLEEEDGPVYSADTTSGSLMITDGPYVESKEFLGGFALVDVADDEAAKMWAGKVAEACGWPLGPPLQAAASRVTLELLRVQPVAGVTDAQPRSSRLYVSNSPQQAWPDVIVSERLAGSATMANRIVDPSRSSATHFRSWIHSSSPNSRLRGSSQSVPRRGGQVRSSLRRSMDAAGLLQRWAEILGHAAPQPKRITC